jgi:hypothetical protein
MSNWLRDWMQSENVASLKQLDRALKDDRARKRLWDLAEQVPYTTEPLPPLTGPTVLAGTGMDLSGRLDSCFGSNCRQHDIERLFSKVWHYFDHIVIVGPSAQAARENLRNDMEDRALLKVRADAQLLLYLSDVGAEDMVFFREKPPACIQEHFKKHARNVGIRSVNKLVEIEAMRLLPNAHIIVEEHDGHWDYALTHEDLEHKRWGAVPKLQGGDDIRLAVCRDVATSFAAYLTSDIRTARSLRVPLGSSARIHGHMLSRIRTGLMPATAGNVAFDLDLPVLHGVSPKDLLALRRDEHESFEKFRTNLRRAVEERLAYSSDVQRVESEIQQDLINPALNEISLRLRKAEEAFQRKNRINISLAVLSIACGLLGEVGLATVFAAATTASAVAAEAKIIEERRDIALEEMYFLWKAANLK